MKEPVAEENLGARVLDGAAEGGEGGLAGASVVGRGAEVNELDGEGLVDDDVLVLEVPVYDAQPVQVGDGGDELAEDERDEGLVELGLPVDELEQVHPRPVPLHDQLVEVRVGEDVRDGDDVGVADGGEEGELDRHAPPVFRLHPARRQHLVLLYELRHHLQMTSPFTLRPPIG